jgi:hypothetical protein
MAGGLLQLVASQSSKEDLLFLTGSPQITFFKKVYRRYVSFSTDFIDLYFDSPMDFGMNGICKIVNNGDLLYRVAFSAEIPEIITKFLKPKSSDIVEIIQSSPLFDVLFGSDVKKTTSNNDLIDIVNVLNTIDITQLEYVWEIKIRQDVKLKLINNFDNINDNYLDFKYKLLDLWIYDLKEKYDLIKTFIKYFIDNQTDLSEQIPLIDTGITIDIVLYTTVFYNLIPSRELLLTFYLKHLNFTDSSGLTLTFDSLIESFNIVLSNKFANVYTKLPQLQILNDIYNPSITNNITVYNPVYSSLDSYFLLNTISSTFGNSHSKIIDTQNLFYDFGPEQKYMINVFNLCLKTLNHLSQSIPLIIVKGFIVNGSNVNIYTDNKSYELNTFGKFSAFLDPNFKIDYFDTFNNAQTLYQQNNIYSNQFPNAYLQLLNGKLLTVSNNLENNFNELFTYYHAMFENTSRMKQDPNLNLIDQELLYYHIPDWDNNVDPNSDLHFTKNVFNLNFLIISFLKQLSSITWSNDLKSHLKSFNYLNPINASNFIDISVNQLIINTINLNQTISYKLNDLYKNGVSINNNNSNNKIDMRNYSSPSYEIDPNIHYDIDQLVIYSIIFHRNLVPQIMEIFQDIFYYCQTIGSDNDNDNEKIIDIRQIKLRIQIYYQTVLKYFMDKYDSFNFEAPANYTFNDLIVNQKEKTVNYVLYKFSSNTPKLTLTQPLTFDNKYLPTRIDPIVLNQMEFYFISEFIHSREISKLFSEMTFNEELITTSVGNTSYQLVHLINDYFTKVDNNYEIDIEKLDTEPDRTKNYYQEIYDHNVVLGLKDYLYYTTFPIMNIILPDLKPINTKYYNQNLSRIKNNKFIKVFYDTTRVASLNTKENNTIYQIFPIDYFRIKPYLFYNPFNNLNSILFEQDRQFSNALLEITRLISQLVLDYELYSSYSNSNTDNNLINSWIIMAIDYVLLSDRLNESSKLILIKIRTSLLTNKYTLEEINKYSIESKIIYQNNSIPLTYRDLIFNNIYISNLSSIDNLNMTSNIRFVIGQMRDNYKLQNYYYVQYEQSIVNLNNLGYLNDKFSFKNISTITYDILSEINVNNVDLNLLKNVSTYVFLYQDYYPEQIKQLQSLYTRLDDFSQCISQTLVSFFDKTTTNISAPRLTIRDVYDTINTTFNSFKQIYQYLINDQALFEYIYAILTQYEYYFNLKLTLYDDYYDYLESKSVITQNDINNLVEISIVYGIKRHLAEKEFESFSILFNNTNYYSQIILLSIKLLDDIDYMLIKSLIDPKVKPKITFKEYINDLIFSNKTYDLIDSKLEIYFNLISNNNYPFIKKFIDIALDYNFNTDDIINTVYLITRKDFLNDQQFINTQYNGFNNINNLLEYFLDWIFDYVMSVQNEDPSLFVKQILLPNRITLTFNQINLYYDKLLMDYFESSEQLINELESNNDNYYDLIDYYYFTQRKKEQTEIIAYMVDTMNRTIELLLKRSNELIQMKNSLYNVFYRNINSKNAWIRKLGHFLIKKVIIRTDGQIIDTQYSDWINIWYELTQNPGTQRSYDIMIGNIPELTTFNDKPKPKHLLFVHNIFWFNRNYGMALPLVGLINTNIELEVELRPLDDLLYKEQFSSFVVTPKLNNIKLIAEYIYLDNNERMLFASKKLEYLIEQTQFDMGFGIDDENTQRVYKLATTQRNVVVKTKSKQTIEQEYNFNRGIYITDTDLEDKSLINLIPNNQYKYLRGRFVPTRDMDNPLVHAKRVEHRMYFENPTEFYTNIIRMSKHVQPELRKSEDEYFYGEKQWDNYGLYSYYDLSDIVNAKKDYYNQLQLNINNPSNKDYGFIRQIDLLIKEYHDPSHKYFVLTLKRLKILFIKFDFKNFMLMDNVIRLKENIIAMKINYAIIKPLIHKLIDNIYKELDLYFDSDLNLNINSMPQEISIDQFIVIIKELLINQIDLQMNINVDMIINRMYIDYNELLINILIGQINEYTNLNTIDYDINNIIQYFYDVYQPIVHNDILKKYLLRMCELILDYINNATTTVLIQFNYEPIAYLHNKTIIYNLVPITNANQIPIPITTTNLIAMELNTKLNQIINLKPVKLIDYDKNIVPNPKVSPLKRGYLLFNSQPLFPKDMDELYWNAVQPWQNFLRSPSVGINVYSWSINPFLSQPCGSANLSRITEFKGIFDVDQSISNNNPATMYSYVFNINVWRVISGLCGTAFEN